MDEAGDHRTSPDGERTCAGTGIAKEETLRRIVKGPVGQGESSRCSEGSRALAFWTSESPVAPSIVRFRRGD